MTDKLKQLLDNCTKKQRSFALAITEIGAKGYNNSQQAAMIAGAEGSYETVAVTGCKWVKNPKVKAVISCIQAEREAECDVTRQECVDNARWQVQHGRANADTNAVKGGNEQLCKMKGVYQADKAQPAAVIELDDAEREALRDLARAYKLRLIGATGPVEADNVA